MRLFLRHSYPTKKLCQNFHLLSERVSNFFLFFLQRALFGSRLASRFLYKVGLGSSEYAFYEYVSDLLSAAKPAKKE